MNQVKVNNLISLKSRLNNCLACGQESKRRRTAAAEERVIPPEEMIMNLLAVLAVRAQVPVSSIAFF